MPAAKKTKTKAKATPKSKPPRKGATKSPTKAKGKAPGGKAAKPRKAPLKAAAKPKRVKPLRGGKSPVKRTPKPLKPVPVVAAPVAPPPPPARYERLWYVIAVEPGTDRRVRKEILMVRARESLENKIGRVVCPYEAKDVELPTSFEKVEEGVEAEANAAKQTALDRAWDMSGYSRDGRKFDPEGYRTTIHPTKGVEKGRIGNTWTWKVSRVVENKRTVSAKSLTFPGYVILNLHFDDETFHLLKKVRGMWGFLPLPITTGRRPTIADKNALEEWKPTALATEEAAMILIRQAEENKKVAARKQTVSLKPGDRVVVNDGAWVETVATVKQVTGTAEPVITVEISFMGRNVSVNVRPNQIRLTPTE